MSKLVRKIILYIIIFYIFWLGILPLILTNIVTVVCKNLSCNTNYEIFIDKPSFKLYISPIIKFRAQKIQIKDKSSSEELVFSGVNTKARILPMLSGQIHVNSFFADNIFIKKTVQPDAILSRNFFENIKQTRFILNSIKVSNLSAVFLSSNTNIPITYRAKDIKLDNKNRFFSVTVDSNLKIEGMDSKIFVNLYLPKNNDINKSNFDIDISNLDIEPIGEFFKNFLPKDIRTFTGKLNVLADKDELFAKLNGVKILYRDNDASIVLPENLTVKSEFQISSDSIYIKRAELNSANISLLLSGIVKNYLGKTMPIVDIKAIINHSKVEDFISMIPPFRVEEFDGYKLKKYRFYGDVLGNLNIAGRFPEPNVSGNLYIDNGILIKPIPNTTKGATIKIKLTGRHANYNVFVPAGNGQNVRVKGVQELYNVKYGDLTVKSTSNVDLHSAEEVVNPLHEIFNFVVGPLPILDVYGTGNIDLTVKGNRSNPHAWGIINFYDTQVNFTEMPDLILEKAHAVLEFNDLNAMFKTLKGQVNGKDFKISGKCDFSGKFDFDVLSENQPAENLYKAITTSSMIDDVKKIIPKFNKISGTADLKLKIFGNVKYIEDLVFNKNAFAKGEISLKDNNIWYQNINISKLNSVIKVDGTSLASSVDAFIGELPFKTVFKVKNNVADLVLDSPKFNLNTLIEDENLRNSNYLPFVSAKLKYRGDINNIEYDKINLNSKIYVQNSNGLFDFKTGEISLINNKLSIKNLDFYIKDKTNNIKADLQVEDIVSKSPILDGNLKIKISDLKILNEIFGKKILPKEINNYLKDYEFENGGINTNIKISDNRLNSEINLAGIKFTYLPFELPIEVLNGNLDIRNNDIRLNKINILADNMPILLDGTIKDITGRKMFDIYINSKPKQDFVDKFINKNTIYPLKIKGDIVYSGSVKGVSSSYDLKSNINMNKDSTIYYYGATVGDLENAILLNLDSKINNKREIRIKEFLYDKLIDSQNGKKTRLNMLKVKGGINLLNDDIEFKDLYIKTSNPTDARIFNLIFGRPHIKQGQFTSDLRLRGRLSNPKILGDFHIVETDIPFFDIIMKNIEFIFKDKVLEISSKGEIFGNDVSAVATLKNEMRKPYHIIRAEIITKDMNLNRVVEKLKSTEIESVQTQENAGFFDINSLIINSLKLKAENIVLRNIHAKNFEAETSLNPDRIFEMKNFVFNIAQGGVKGKYSYNLGNNDIKLNMSADKISANDITWAIFDLQNQIYGDMTGNVNLSCNGDSFEKCLQTLNGLAKFNVKDGRMPKLGSLEYLLKAGNLVKSGITGLSINGVIDLISPMKTGEFSDIFGFINIKDGVANDIEITTQGKDLSLFIGGTYNFATSNADMEVLGLLSRKISTMFGPIGNISVNTLFNLIPGVDLSKDGSVIEKINRIPGIEITDKAHRKFIAIIKGNINGDNYVTSFKWIN